MKKIFAIILVAVLVLTGCSNTDPDPVDPGTDDVTYKIGTYALTHLDGTDATAEAEGEFQADTYYATVVLEDDVIVYVDIDVAQNVVTFDLEGTSFVFDGKGTKTELGDDYGMAVYNPAATAEWYVQMASFEEWMIGKTVAEVLALDTVEKDESHPAVPNIPDLTSSVTISVESYLEAVEGAAAAAVEVENIDKVSVVSSTSASDTALEINTYISAIALDADGKIIYSFLDVAQSRATLEAGVITVAADTRTKYQKGDDYGMTANSDLEWYEHADAFMEWTLGKTPAEVAGAASDSDLTSTVTVAITGFISAYAKAAEKAVDLK